MPRYDEVISIAAQAIRDSHLPPGRVAIVRDVTGRIRVVLGDVSSDHNLTEIDELSEQLVSSLGKYAPSSDVLLPKDRLVSVEELFEHADSRTQLPGRGGSDIILIEHAVTGSDWLKVPDQTHDTWVALYSFKGGVGRSTAGAWLSRQEAAQGKCVLVVDLDLESPGITQLLQNEQSLPNYGLVDHLAEAAVGNERGLDLVAQAYADDASFGEVWVLPAQGRPREGYEYLSKLNRVYAPAVVEGHSLSFADRLEAAITAAVQAVSFRSRTPDLVLLDSRAGLHDIAAVTVTKLAGMSLIFASDTAATWQGYEYLAQEWAATPQLAHSMRNRFKMVAALAPEIRESEYVQRFSERAYECWSRLYDDILPDDVDLDSFHPLAGDEEAPHHPLAISFDLSLRNLERDTFDAVLESRVAQSAYAEFVDGFRALIGGRA